MMRKIELLKLVHGQELIGEITEDDVSYYISHPHFLLPHSDGILLIASSIYGDCPENIVVNKSLVLFKTNIKAKYYEAVVNEWLKNVSNPIIDIINDCASAD